MSAELSILSLRGQLYRMFDFLGFNERTKWILDNKKYSDNESISYITVDRYLNFYIHYLDGNNHRLDHNDKLLSLAHSALNKEVRRSLLKRKFRYDFLHLRPLLKKLYQIEFVD